MYKRCGARRLLVGSLQPRSAILSYVYSVARRQTDCIGLANAPRTGRGGVRPQVNVVETPARIASANSIKRPPKNASSDRSRREFPAGGTCND